jgi:hypothetical protein
MALAEPPLDVMTFAVQESFERIRALYCERCGHLEPCADEFLHHYAGTTKGCAGCGVVQTIPVLHDA